MSARTLDAARNFSLGLARRALDLARDPGLSREDSASHLVRLAKERQLPLHLALAHLRRSGSTSAVCEHACMLLRLGIAELEARSELNTRALPA
jgi:hypothetical protein